MWNPKIREAYPFATVLLEKDSKPQRQMVKENCMAALFLDIPKRKNHGITMVQ